MSWTTQLLEAPHNMRLESPHNMRLMSAHIDELSEFEWVTVGDWLAFMEGKVS